MKYTNILLTFVLSLAVMILFGSLAQASRAASFTVNSTLDIPDFDAGDGVCQTINARQCTLRAAISEANALAGDDIIFLPAGVYITTRPTLGDDANVGGDFDITSNITINGAAAGSTFIQAASSAGAATERVLHFVAGTSTVNGATIRYGSCACGELGGGVYTGSNTNVTLNQVTISNNSIPLEGGGIYNLGTLSLTNSAISDNRSGSGGGGISSSGTLSLTNSTVSGNSASGSSGGGISSSGTLTLANTTISGNSATDGGGINNGSTGMLTLTNTLISNNTAGFDGGGILNRGTMTLMNSTVSGNSASGSVGGGIYSLSGGVITNSTVSNNHSGLHGGGISSSSTLTLTNSTVSGNSARNAGGGIYSSGTLALTNSTVSGNSATENGGGILSGGLLTLTGSTLSGNSTVFGVGGILITFAGTANLNNTIIANSISGADCIGQNGGTINAQYSLIEEGLGCVNGINTNNLTGDPLLGPLQDNGGPTPTHALLPGSPAIDKGSSFSLTTDQRGMARPVDISSISNASDGTDIGAFEAQAPTAASVSVSGRVLAEGAGVFGAIVTMTDGAGATRSARTNPFGYYHFTDVQAGATYVFSVSSKQYSFSPQVVMVYEEMTDLNFTMGK
jgi:CSLREA domain-containing protein